MTGWKKEVNKSSELIPLNLFYNFLPRNKVASHTAPLAHNRFGPGLGALQNQPSSCIKTEVF
jgi:hypothetical protein